jgi:hypothetical protein
VLTCCYHPFAHDLQVEQAQGLADHCVHLEAALGRTRSKLPRIREISTQTSNSFLADVRNERGAGVAVSAAGADRRGLLSKRRSKAGGCIFTERFATQCCDVVRSCCFQLDKLRMGTRSLANSYAKAFVSHTLPHNDAVLWTCCCAYLDTCKPIAAHENTPRY